MNEWFWLLQICVDLLLLTLFVVILANLRRLRKDSKGSDDEPIFEFDDDRKKELEVLQESLESLVSRVQRVTTDAVGKITEAVNQAEVKEDELTTQIALIQKAQDETAKVGEDLASKEVSSVEMNQERTNARILELSNQGATVEEIARELQIGRGEVNLVIDIGRAGKNG